MPFLFNRLLLCFFVSPFPVLLAFLLPNSFLFKFAVPLFSISVKLSSLLMIPSSLSEETDIILFFRSFANFSYILLVSASFISVIFILLSVRVIVIRLIFLKHSQMHEKRHYLLEDFVTSYSH